MGLQLKFDANQPHQLAGIRNVVDLFDGLSRSEAPFQLSNEVIPNLQESADFADCWLEENLHAVQRAHNDEHPDAGLPITRLERDDGPLLEGVSNDSYGCPHFTIEMETGTGKTYVYFRTMQELYKLYGISKFIVVVPSVAILEGVKKAFDITSAHFISLYGVNNFSLIEYDGAHPGKIGSFAKTSFPVVMVMTQQSFNQAKNNFYKPTEKLSGEWKPYQWVQATRPVVILDEPQNMGTERARESIRTLKPLFVLRYSATHRKGQQPNPVYRLTPVQAFRFGLVKQIEVVGVAELGTLTTSMLRLEEVLQRPIRARVRLLRLKDGRTTEEVITLKQGDRLGKHTKLAEQDGIEVAEIVVGKDGEPSRVEFTGGESGGFSISTSDEVVGSRKDVWRAQIERTIEAHFERQKELQRLGVKVLSLFFIDRVNNYVDEPGTIRQLFDESFDRLKVKYPEWRDRAASEVRSGYFAKSKKKEKGGKVEREVYLDDVKPEDEAAKAAYKLILQKKETLLSFPDGKDPDKNVAFIFAHSALREGWDNPNVFQICTLNQSTSSMRKRQEIGRGLRLCVDQKGNRPEGANVNILTVVANESYESYVRNLQQDYVDDGEGAPPPPRRPADSKARRRDNLYNLPEFRSFWRQLCKRLTYTIQVDSDALMDECVERLAKATFPEPLLTVSHGRFVVVEYALRVKERITEERARIVIETRSSETVEKVLPFFKADEVEPIVGVGDDLGRITHNPHLRGFKVTRVWDQYGEMRVRFANDVEVSESELHRFQATRIDERHGRETVVATDNHPVPDFIGRAADETRLTRATLLRVFEKVSLENRQKLLRNPEGWANLFVSEISEVVKDHIAARVRYHATDELLKDADPEDPESFFPEVVPHPQKELIAGGLKSLYDQVQIDSDVERRFVQSRLQPDEDNLFVYFKFPPKFKIELPRIIGNYNPDWGVVRFDSDGQMAIELVRETKGNDDLTKLRFTNEGRKLKVAQRYFKALGIDYRYLSPEAANYGARAEEPPAPKTAPKFQIIQGGKPKGGQVAIPVYDLRIAAGAFSEGQSPGALGQVFLPRKVARLPGLFVAEVVGDSMDRVASPGSYCLWQHLGAEGAAAPARGERLVARREGSSDPELGEFTFKRWGGGTAKPRLEPMSSNPKHKPIELKSSERPEFVARFVQVLSEWE